jgi:hypothetical protein
LKRRRDKEPRGIAGARAHSEEHATGRELRVRYVDLRLEWVVQAPAANILDDSHDVPRSRSEDLHEPFERILAWKIALGRPTIHDRNQLGLGAICVRKVATGRHRNAHRAEVSGCGRSEFGVGAFAGRVRAACDSEGGSGGQAGEREVADCRGILDVR